MMRTKFYINRQNIYSYIFAILFFGMLFAPVLKSGWTFDNIGENFNWRRDLIYGYNLMRLKLGDRVFSNSIVGKDGWVFFTGDQTMDYYQHTNLLSKKKLSEIGQSLDQLNSRLRESGITLIVLIPANRESIYSEYMPDEIPVLEEKSRLDQFVKYMRLHGETPIVDLRSVLAEASISQQVYFKKDTHWNSYGAYYAYREFFSVLSESYPELRPHPLSDYEIIRDQYSMGMNGLMGIPPQNEENFLFEPKFNNEIQSIRIQIDSNPRGRSVIYSSNSDPNLPTALVYHDSFFNFLRYPFFEPHFSEMISVSYMRDPTIWNLKWIEVYKPDIVIIELVERYLFSLLPQLLSSQ